MKTFPYIKIIAFAACLVPLGQLTYNAAAGNLGANPIEAITRFTGSWALIFILVTLGVTPLRKTAGWNDLIKLRRMIGLFAFFYACLHFATYVVLDHFFDFQTMVKDVIKRPYVTAGFTAFVLMIPLAITSSAAMIQRLGRRWQQLHYLVYVVAIAGVLHFYWLVKADIRRPVLYGSVLALLLGYRLVPKWSPALALRRFLLFFFRRKRMKILRSPSIQLRVNGVALKKLVIFRSCWSKHESYFFSALLMFSALTFC